MEKSDYGGNLRVQFHEILFYLQGGSEGAGDDQFFSPHDVTFDSKGNVYVTDRDRNDIKKFR